MENSTVHHTMEKALKSYFGFSALRPYQQEVIQQVLNGRDCLVIVATGGGKSMCYQMPPLISGKTAVVVSPLLSLMHDQVMSLRQKGVKSDYLGSTQTNNSVTKYAEKGLYDVLYMTPEKATSLSPSFWSKLTSIGVCLFAVDEAHCISEWGHEFRVVYKKLHLLRKFLASVPYIALTATATNRVREDIKSSLGLIDPHIHIGSFDRPNLFYGVKCLQPTGRIAAFIKEILPDVSKRCIAGDSTIIYCSTIRDTEEVYSTINSYGIGAACYHGQMDSSSREKSHRSFVGDETLVMVATIAFGMGIDKPNVRCVIHLGCPRSLEAYYQESGRCGRDGLPSVCWLFYSRTDFTRGDFYCGDTKDAAQRTAIMDSFIAGQKYCLIGSCKRENLLRYFGEETTSVCGNCENCTSSRLITRDLSR